ncbi:hypothetical protein ACLFMI_12250 [Pseudonocardia nantongensis]|uniref:hypothetical protein n=1 Tax=Pseudonocardia nantongensis TaxID=1181885 RepID=UPI00397C7B18
MSAPGQTSVRSVRGVRRAMIVTVVGSLVVAAVLGILALVSGEFGELQARIVLTTTTVAAFGTTSLCHLAVVTRSVRAVGFAGIAASLGAAVCALVLTWRDWSGDGAPDEVWWKALGVLTLAAVSLAQANLLLLLAGRTSPAVRASLAGTLLAITGVAVLIALPILTEGEVPGPDGSAYWRWLGVLGILDALGTIALPVLGLVLRRGPGPGPGPGSGSGSGSDSDSDSDSDSEDAHRPATVRLVLELPVELAERLDDRADTREVAAVALLERELRR